MTKKKPILVIRLSAIGDIILAASLMGQFAEEGREIHLLVKDAYRSIGSSLPGVQTVWSWDRERALISSRITQYDAVLDLQGTRKTKNWSRKFEIPVHVYRKPYLRRALLLLTKSNRFALDHVVERYGKAAAPLLQKPFDHQPRVLNMLGVEVASVPKDPIALVIGGTHSGKKLSYEGWKKVITSLKPLNRSIVLLGGPEEAGIGEALEQPLGSGITNYCGKLSLLASIEVVKNAAVVITGDTGLMHASALFGRPVISLWGATHPSLGFTPWPAQPQERMIITKSLWSPASKHGQRPFWMPNPMKKLPLEKILVLTAQILQDKTKP